MKIAHNPVRFQTPIVIAIALLAGSALARAQVSLATVVDLAQRHSAAVRLAEADVEKARAGLSETKDVYVPSVELGSGLPAVPAVGFTGGVPSILSGTMRSLVFSFSQLQYIKAARAGLDAASLSLKNAREQVALDASTAYIELDTVNRELDAVHQEEGFASRLVAIEQQRGEAGVDPLSDLLQARLTAEQLKLRRLHLETRAGSLAKQLSELTGLPVGSIIADHASIPEIPAITANDPKHAPLAVQSAEMIAVSRQKTARGTQLDNYLPQLSFNAQYLRNTTILNNFDAYYKLPIPTNNFGSEFAIQIPIFNMERSAKAKESAAEALRAKVEVEQAQQQNDLQIVEITGNLRELDALAEIASLKQQIANEQVRTVLAQLELGNGSETGANAQPQLTPKAEQLARIDEREKSEDALDAGLNLSKARLNLLRALGHLEDWLHELHGK